jgi:hypothetical protein
VETLAATRVLSSIRRGSSWPIVVETLAGPRLVKLRGAGQGTGPLVAEVIVGALAEALELHVPARTLVVLDRLTPTDDKDEELADLLAASTGVNLGFELLHDARDVQADDIASLDPAEAAAVLWLDRLVLNSDRTLRNPNLLLQGRRLYLIDHGAALRFQYDWAAVTEAAARRIVPEREPHLLRSMAQSEDWTTWDAVFAGRLTRAVLQSAVSDVPDTFLLPLLPVTVGRPSTAAAAEALHRRRAAYVAFLWKRLQPPRAFAGAGVT